VTIRHSETEADVFLTHTENIGIGGVCVILKRGLKIFSSVALEVDLLDTEEHIKCDGRVVWSVRRRSDEKKKPLFYDIGIEFNALPQENQNRLNTIVQRLVKQGHKVAEH
jgi:Tfp pilus assembly protein PilZ